MARKKAPGGGGGGGGGGDSAKSMALPSMEKMGMMPCAHNCVDKTACQHACCKTGVSFKRRRLEPQASLADGDAGQARAAAARAPPASGTPSSQSTAPAPTPAGAGVRVKPSDPVLASDEFWDKFKATPRSGPPSGSAKKPGSGSGSRSGTKPRLMPWRASRDKPKRSATLPKVSPSPAVYPR